MGENPYREVLQSKRTQEDFKSYGEIFKVRLFYQKYRGVSRVVYYTSFIFNLLSITSGVLGVASLLVSFIYPDLYLMAIPAFLILAISEYLKRTVFTNLVVGFYRDGRKLSFVLLAVTLGFIGISGIATVKGGIEVVKLARNEVKPTLTNIKSLESGFNKQISELKAKQQKLIARNTYQGNTYLNPEKEAVYQQWEDDIRKVRSQKQKAIANAGKSNSDKLKVHASGTKEYVIIFIVLSILIESLCLLAIWFPIFFKFRSLSDKYAIEEAYADKQYDIAGLLSLMQVSQISIPLPLREKSQPQQLKVQGENEKGTDEKSKVPSEKIKVHPENLKVPTEKLKVQPQKIKAMPIFSIASHKTINPCIVPPIKPQETESTEEKMESTEEKTESADKIPKSPYGNGRGPTLPYDEIDPYIKKGKLKNSEIAELFGCAESSIVKRRRKLKELNGETIKSL